jgi:hypothetical protein
MSTAKTPEVPRPPLADAAGSAVCNWYKTGKGMRCDSPAIWSAPTQRGQWLLCDFHKTMLLSSYNDEYRKKDEPRWKRLPLPPNK